MMNEQNGRENRGRLSALPEIELSGRPSQEAPVPPCSSAPKTVAKRRRVAVAATVLVLLLLAAGGLYIWQGPGTDGWLDPGAKAGQYEGKSEEEIIAALNAQVAEGMMNISIASTIRFDTSDAEGEARIENIEANHVDQKVTLTLDDTGETVFESGAIAPGQYLQRIKLNKQLEPGTYPATATFTGYNRETHDKTGAAGAQVTIIVGS